MFGFQRRFSDDRYSAVVKSPTQTINLTQQDAKRVKEYFDEPAKLEDAGIEEKGIILYLIDLLRGF